MCIKDREFSLDLKIDTMDNPTLARILELYQKQLEFFGKRLAGGADQSAQKQKQDVHWMQVHFTRAES